jgi:hypothetical protein
MRFYLVHTRAMLSLYPSHVDPSHLHLCAGPEDTQCLDIVVEDDHHGEGNENASDGAEGKQEQARKTL